MLRACERCGSEFTAKASAVALGHGRYCSLRCSNTREHNPNWRGGRADVAAGYLKRFGEKYPEKIKAYRIVEAALRTGRLKKKPCLHCGRTDGRIVAHHTDYSKPLKVTWLCDPCHKTEHQRLSRERGDTKAPPQDNTAKCPHCDTVRALAFLRYRQN